MSFDAPTTIVVNVHMFLSFQCVPNKESSVIVAENDFWLKYCLIYVWVCLLL